MTSFRYVVTFVSLCVIVCWLSGCAQPFASTPPPTVPVPLSEALQQLNTPALVVGYLYNDADGTRLVPAISESVGAAPQPITGQTPQVWLDDAAVAAVLPQLSVAGQTRTGVALVRGQLQGPGQYGRDGRYGYTISAAQVELAPVAQTNIEGLLSSATKASNVVQVRGALLADARSARLSERLGPGGVPEGTARQIKLSGPLEDAALWEKLQHPGNGSVRFGEVEIVALWRDGVLIPLFIRTLPS